MQTNAPEPADALPRLRDDLRGTPFQEGFGAAASGKFLVEAGESCYLLSADTWAAVQELAAGPATLAAFTEAYALRTGNAATPEEMHALVWERLPRTLFADTPVEPRRPPFIFHRRLLSPEAVGTLTRRLAWVYSPAVAVLVALAFATSLVVTLVTGPATPATLAPGELGALIALVLASMLVHELGHAAACTRFGCPHGEVGWGVYLYLPMLYTDVTRAWRLSPRQRAVVDLGGLYFQAIIVPALAFWAWYSGSHVAQSLVWINVYMMLHALNPMFKMDGYWLLTDLSGLTNLHRRTGAALKAGFLRLAGRPAEEREGTGPVRTAVLHAYTAMCLAYFAFVIHMLSSTAPRVLAAYPATAARHLGHLGDALGAGAAGTAAGALLSLLASTIPPAILCLASYFVGRRIFRLAAGLGLRAWRLARAGSLHTATPPASA